MTLNSPESPPCVLCGNRTANRVMTASEKMYGLGEEFRYLRCADCGVLHLLDIPVDYSRYYPASGYYSVNARSGALRRRLMQLRDRGCAGESVLGAWLGRHFANPTLESALRVVSPGKRVLDVGCGGGELLKSLASLGHAELVGVDPLLSASSESGGVRLVAGQLASIDGPFDVIMFHHSLEHMPEQVEVLVQARERLAPGGLILVRVPTCESLAAEAFGTDWFQLDAPRHLFLHSHRSLRRVAERAGLTVESLTCDSQPMQFWASEMYQDGLPLVSPRAGEYRRRHRAFNRRLSAWANFHLRGDQIVVHLRA